MISIIQQDTNSKSFLWGKTSKILCDIPQQILKCVNNPQAEINGEIFPKLSVMALFEKCGGSDLICGPTIYLRSSSYGGQGCQP